MTERSVVVGRNGRAKAYRPLSAAKRSAALKAGLAAYERGDFFQAHEDLEPAWMGTSDLPERALLQGLIKVAAAYVHDVRGNPAGIARNLEGLEFDEKLRRVVAWIGRAGTLAEQSETAEGVKVTIHNCPFRNTALKFPQVCTITPHLISQLLGTAVSQADSIHRHDPYCSFVVQRPTDPH